MFLIYLSLSCFLPGVIIVVVMLHMIISAAELHTAMGIDFRLPLETPQPIAAPSMAMSGLL